MSNSKFAVIVGTVGSCSDRFVTGGYGSPYQRDEYLDNLAKIEKVLTSLGLISVHAAN